MPKKKVHKLRIHKAVQVIQGASSGGGISSFNNEAFQGLRFALRHMEKTGVLGCPAEIVNVGKEKKEEQVSKLSGRGAVIEKGR
jgi:hypothetical protein